MRLTLLLLLLPLLTYSQLNDNFDDGDFTNGTEWEGDTGDFRINTNKQLQLNSTGEGSSFLSTALNPANLSEWNFLIKLGFSPSDNNQCIVYLVTNHPDPELCTAAFYLKFGKSGSDDAIELYKQIDTTHSLIASGDPGFINTSFCIRVKITRDDGYWQILADSTGGYDFRLQATANDDYWGSYNRFSILCRHTSSNATKFYFDDIYAGPMVFDVIPPSLAGLALKQPSFINLTFNEPLMPESCSDVSDYHLEPVGLFPAAAGIDPEERNKVHLLFDDEFAEGEQYGLMIKDIRDVAGNRMKDTLIHFTW
ncbi:MAG TPA: hypothetical protein VHO68_03840, partial [Bacteroidales bacterium]|nr:hypothetical protein [Bacteroidales bacterium]